MTILSEDDKKRLAAVFAVMEDNDVLVYPKEHLAKLFQQPEALIEINVEVRARGGDEPLGV